MQWLDLLVSLLVLVAVSLAVDHGGAALAALVATAPTGMPLSLYLVKSAAERAESSSSSQLAQLDIFLASCIRGGLAAVAFAGGALWLVRTSKGGGGGTPSLAALLFVGYGCWGAAWTVLRYMPV